MQTGAPAKLGGQRGQARRRATRRTFSAARRSRSPLAGTLAWLWLVRWRTGRHRHALWKSLVLPAGGVALCWLLRDDAAACRRSTTRAATARWCSASRSTCRPAPASPRRACRARRSSRSSTSAASGSMRPRRRDRHALRVPAADADAAQAAGARRWQFIGRERRPARATTTSPTSTGASAPR